MLADRVTKSFENILTESCDRISHKGQQRGNYSAPLIRGDGMAGGMKEVSRVWLFVDSTSYANGTVKSRFCKDIFTTLRL